MSGPVAHLEIASNDPGAAMKYYGEVLGWQLSADNPMNYGMGRASDDVGLGIGPVPEGAPGPHAIFYTSVDDVEATLAKAESAGGKRLMGPTDVPEGPTIGHFADPEGNVVGVFNRM